MGNREFDDIPVNSPAYLLRFKTSFMRFGESFDEDIKPNSTANYALPCSNLILSSYLNSSGAFYKSSNLFGSSFTSGSGTYFGLGYGIELI